MGKHGSPLGRRNRTDFAGLVKAGEVGNKQDKEKEGRDKRYWERQCNWGAFGGGVETWCSRNSPESKNVVLVKSPCNG